MQPCDCRLMVFDSVAEAQSVWIKGHGFSISKMLGQAYSAEWQGCSIALSRLAPGDHHRFYVPCACTISSMTPLEGDHYSVKPVRYSNLALSDAPCVRFSTGLCAIVC